MAAETHFNVFVSSPGDVQAERERVDFVVERINADFRGRARVRTIRWETQYYSSHDTFQAQIPEAATCDLVVAIFGARLGSALPETFRHMPSGEPYPSGTAYEVLSAMEGRRSGRENPDIYVFRRPHAPLVALDAADRDEIEAQWRRLSGFFETWFRNRGGQFLAAFQEFDSTDEFESRVEACLRQWLARQGFHARGAVWDRARLGSPYPGLAAFDEVRQSVFFGRSLAIDQAIERLRDAERDGADTRQAPFLLLIGASGSGKSSLLRAGLAPRIALPGIIPEIDLWRRAVLAPDLDPFASLAEALLGDPALGPELKSGAFASRDLLSKMLAGDPEPAAALIREGLREAAAARARAESFDAPRPARLFLGIDQAERLFSESSPELAERFARLLARLVDQRLASVVLVLRSDAYARFQALEPLVKLRDAGATLDLLPATAAELEEMATRPTELCDPPLRFETRDGRSLASRLVEEAKGGDALPLMQITLARLYAAETTRGDGVLRYADYQGLGEAVTQTANEALGRLEAAARAQLPDLIAGLVHDIAADPLTGEPKAISGVLDRSRFEAGRPERATLVEAFVAVRLLTAEGDAATQRVRPTHEALLRIWPEAVAIISDAAHLIRTRHALAPIVREWQEAPDSDKAQHLEISSALLDGAQRYIARFGEEASPEMLAFVAAASAVAAARHERDRQEQKRRIDDAEEIARANKRIARRSGVGLVAALALAAVAGGQWWSADLAKRDAQAQRDRAERNLGLAVETAGALVHDLAQKFRSESGVQKSIVIEILDKARALQEQLLHAGESNAKLKAQHAAALGEIGATELALGDAPAALALERQAREIYAQLAVAAPDNVAYAHNVGIADKTIVSILQQQGDIDGALAAFRRAWDEMQSTAIKASDDPRIHALSIELLLDMGAREMARDNLEGALKAYREAQALAKRLQAQDPSSTMLRNSLAVTDRSAGDALLAQDDLDGATKEFDAAREIAGGLAREQPNNSDLQRDLSLSDERLGKTLMMRGNYAAALNAYNAGEATAIAMAANDRDNMAWQYDIAIGHVEIATAHVALGDRHAAVQSYKEAAAIDEVITARDPTNALWRRHKWTTLVDLGDALLANKQKDEALESYRSALAVAQSAAAEHAKDPEWLLLVARSHYKVGDWLTLNGTGADALAEYREGLAGARAIAARAEVIEDAPHQIFVGLNLVGAALDTQNDRAGALSAYREAESLMRGVVEQRPKDRARRRDYILALDYVGQELAATGQHREAVATYRKALDNIAGLPGAGGASSAWPNQEAKIEEHLADALTQLGENDGGLAATRAALALRSALAADAPEDPERQRAQWIDIISVGQRLTAREDFVGALAAFREGLATTRKFALRSGDAAARERLEILLAQTGLAAVRTQDFANAIPSLEEAFAIARSLADAAPADPAIKYWSWLIAMSLGDARNGAGDGKGAVEAYLAAGDVVRGEMALVPARPDCAQRLQATEAKIVVAAQGLLLQRDFAAALMALDKASLATDDPRSFDLVRVPCLMFLDRTDEARAVYIKHKGELMQEGGTWEAAVGRLVVWLRSRGLDHLLMKEIEATTRSRSVPD
jgi:tetratricopeptide (TPR) repeat protein